MTGSPQRIDVAAVVDNRRLGAFNYKLAEHEGKAAVQPGEIRTTRSDTGEQRSRLRGAVAG
jgi:hypothetical protein